MVAQTEKVMYLLYNFYNLNNKNNSHSPPPTQNNALPTPGQPTQPNQCPIHSPPPPPPQSCASLIPTDPK